MTAPGRHPARRLLPLALLAAAAAGCQQKMAQQPYFKPYEQTDQFADGRSNRPLEPGTVHRGQAPDADPLASGLTRDEWVRAWKLDKADRKVDVSRVTPIEDRENAIGAPRFDQRDGGNPKVYVDAFPFEMTAADLTRGQERYQAYCIMCHGPLGNGKGKIWERGYLKPTSYHTEKVAEYEPDESGDQKLGYSRGYGRWGIDIPLRDVPHGYIYEVISRGYGGMPEHGSQIPPADRWRIVAYVRALQLSMHADAGQLAEETRKKLGDGGAAK